MSQGAANSFHHFGIFLQQHPQTLFISFSFDRSSVVLVVNKDLGGLREGEGGGKVGDFREGGVSDSVSAVACHMGICSRARCYFVVFPFISQSKEYPRNVRGNPTRKYVEKEVCKKKIKNKKRNYTEQKGRNWKSEESDGLPTKIVNISIYWLKNQSANWDVRGSCDSAQPWHECEWWVSDCCMCVLYCCYIVTLWSKVAYFFYLWYKILFITWKYFILNMKMTLISMFKMKYFIFRLRFMSEVWVLIEHY